MPALFNEPALGLYSKSMSCPSCKSSYKTMKVRSRFATPHTIDSDFCPHYKEGNLNPNYYYINVCPECGYAYSDEYSQELTVKVKDVLSVKIGEKWERRDFGKLRDVTQVIETFKLAIYSGTIIKEKYAVMGGLCLRLAWIFRELCQKEEEKRFLRLALKEFEDSYVHSDFIGTTLSEMKVLFLAGELNRRLGLFQEAINYFAKAIEHPNHSQERRILILAREQWRLAAEEYRKAIGNTK